ncbi:MAG: class I SAM-dependent methyltransferase, partial [Methanobacteriaceae archaeon]
MNRVNKKAYQTILDNISIENHDYILDIGFGNGYLINKLIKNINFNRENNKMYGIDISEDMVHKTYRKYKSDIISGLLNLEIANIQKMPFKDEFFNKIYTVNTIYFWENVDKSFNEVERVLKKGGLFFNVFYSKDWLDKLNYTKYGFSKYLLNEIKDLTEANNLKIINIIEIYNGNAFCIIS